MTRDLVDLMGGGHGRPLRDTDQDHDPETEDVSRCELELVLHYDNKSRRAILVSDDGHESKAVWLAKSEIEFHSTGRTVKAFTTKNKPLTLPVINASVPEWLAKEKGLI